MKSPKRNKSLQKVIHTLFAENLVFWHCMVDFVRPRRDAALDTFCVLKALLLEEINRLQGTDAALAMDIKGLVWVKFGEALLECAQRKQRHTIDMCDLIFVRFPHVDDTNSKFRILQGPLHFLDRNLIGIGGWSRWFRSDPAKLVVIDELRDCRLVPADGTFRVAPKLEFAKPH